MIGPEARAQPRVAVIGSGFGGLAIAIRLQAAGFDVTIFEGRDRPGGRAYVYEDQGYTFDAGPTVITAPNCLEELFAAVGQRMEELVDLVPVEPFYRLFWEDGDIIDYGSDVARLKEQIAARNPGDVAGYERFLRYAEQIFDEGYTKLAAEPFLDWWSMIRVAPQLARLQAYRTVYDRVAHFIRDSHLRQLFSFHSLLVGGNPFASSSIYTLIHVLERKWGVHFARGGTGALVRALVQVFEDAGGVLRVSCPVTAIRTEGGRVTGVEAGGSAHAVDAVVSNADVVHTYRDLLRREPRAERSAERLAGMRFSMSLVVIYFGVSRRYPNLAHHNVMFGARYRELLDDIFRHGTLAEDFSLYLHAPSVSDESLAPPGHEAFYVLAPVPHLGKADLDWSVEGPRYRDRVLGYLEKRYMPDLSRHLVTTRVFTPADFRDELNAHHGSAFSLEPVLTQSAFFRVHNRDDRIDGLYFAGAGTHPGAGIPGVVNSAKATAKLVLEDFPAASTRPGAVAPSITGETT